MKILLSHPTGNANVKAVLKGLVNGGMLESFYTSLACFPNTFLESLGRFKPLSELHRRNFDKQLQSFTHQAPLKEVGRLLSSKLGISSLTRHETGIFSIDSVCHSIDNHAAMALKKSNKVMGVYSYEDCSLAQFKVAKQKGIQCIYDLPIAYWHTSRKLLLNESIRLPQWATTLAGGIKDSEAKLERKTEELSLADTVIVASQFVKDSLPTIAKDKKIVFSPFGSPLVTFGDSHKKESNKPLRILFAGSMGQRKGLGDLFEAFKLLNNNNIQLIVMGSLLAPLDFYRNQYRDFIYEPPRPHSEVLELMRSCDVFCLPSIVEGRALVMQEAMSQGLPLIITPNTGGEDLIIEGKTGFLVPTGNPVMIAEKINWFYENRQELEIMSKISQKHSESYSWENYYRTIISGILN